MRGERRESSCAGESTGERAAWRDNERARERTVKGEVRSEGEPMARQDTGRAEQARRADARR